MKRLIQSLVAAAALALAVASVVHAAESPLLAAVRAHDLTRARALLAAGENANARDETGASALMYAAVYRPSASCRCVRDIRVRACRMRSPTRRAT